MAKFKKINENLILLKRIGSGGMGEVFLAKRIGYAGFEKMVAVKCYHTTQNALTPTRDLFIREATIGAKLKHGNVIEIYDFGETEESLYMCMEYVRGKQCDQLVTELNKIERTLSPGIATYIIDMAISGMAYAHSLKDEITGENMNLIHRDISPHNIMINYEGQAKLLDFGLAKISSSRALTPKNSILGKYGYLAPEQVLNGHSSQASDVFSLGVTFFELVTGNYLFEGGSTMEILRNNSDCHIPAGWDDDLPDGIKEIASGMLAKDLEDRYSSAAVFSKNFTKLRKQHFPEIEEKLAYLMTEVFADQILEETELHQKLWNEEERLRSQTTLIPAAKEDISDSGRMNAVGPLSNSSSTHQVIKLDARSFKETSKLSFEGNKGPFKKK